ncbi:hypothetical protein V1477_002298, partial [Vespula maculifrons]
MRATIQCVGYRSCGMQPAEASNIHKFIPTAFCQVSFILENLEIIFIGIVSERNNENNEYWI